MRKLLLFLSLALISYADNQSFKNDAEYKEFVTVLESAAKKGDGQKAYALALLYLQPIKIAEQTREADTAKGLDWLDRAEKLGEKMASWQKGMIYLSDREIALASSSFLKVLDSDDGSQNLAFLMAATSYGALILENTKDSPNKFSTIAAKLRPFAIRFDNANMQYIFAHLLFYGGAETEGNIWLNAACKNPNAPDKIRDACNASENIEVFNENGQTLGTCPTL